MNWMQKTILNLKSDEFREYMIVFFIPSSTPLYILMYNGLHLSIVVSYILANAIGGIGSFFLYKAGIFDRIKKIVLRRK